MLLFSGLSFLTPTFWVSLLILVIVAVSIIPLSLGLTQMNLLRRLTNVVLAAIQHCTFRVSQLEGCQMENLPLVRQLIEEENYPQLTATFQEFERDSQKLFHGKWTPDLRHYFDREHLLTPAQFRRLTPDWSYRILAIGLLTGAFFLLLCLTLGTDQTQAVLPVCLLPAIIGTLLYFLTYYRADASRNELDRAMKVLAETATLRLPAFSDLAGSAVLVDAFMQYDRKMEASVHQLSETVSHLLNQEMVTAVSQSITQGIEQSLLPPLQHSHALLQDLATQLERRQDQGMRQLAEQFTLSVSDLLARRLEVFFRELDQYLTQLQGTRGELDQSLQSLETYRMQAGQLDQQIQEHLSALRTHQEQNQQHLQLLTDAQKSLADTSEQLHLYQSGSTNSLSALVGSLAQQVTGFSQSMHTLCENIQSASNQNREALQTLMDAQKHNLDGYRELSETMLTGGQTLNRQADLIQRQMEGMNQQLTESVQTFNQSVTNGVQKVLDQFDTELSDVTDRLSTTAGEIRDAAESIRIADSDRLHDSSNT